MRQITENQYRERCRRIKDTAAELRVTLDDQQSGLAPTVRGTLARRIAAKLASLASELEMCAVPSPSSVQLQELRINVLHAARQALAAEEQIRLRSLPGEAPGVEAIIAKAARDAEDDPEPESEFPGLVITTGPGPTALDMLMRALGLRGLGLIDEDIHELGENRPAIATRLLLEIEVAIEPGHRSNAIGELRGWIRAGGSLPDWTASPAATRRFARASHGVCDVPWPPLAPGEQA